MITLILMPVLCYLLLIKRKPHTLFYFFLPLLAVDNLPSELKEFFVIRIGERLLMPQDLMLLVIVAYFATSPSALNHLIKIKGLSLLVIFAIGFSVAQLMFHGVIYGVEPHHFRLTLSGTLLLTLCLIKMDRLFSPENQEKILWTFTGTNLLVAVSAACTYFFPELNDLQSNLYTRLGIVTEQGTVSYTTPIGVDMCLISLAYFLLYEKRSLAHPVVVLPIVLVFLSAHRISYLAFFVLLAMVFYREFMSGFKIKTRINLLTLTSLVTGMATILIIGYSYFDQIVTLVQSYVIRMASLGDIESLTIQERLVQYGYFFNQYLPNQSFIYILIGEGYLPYSHQDEFYKYVAPHNFILYAILKNGVLGALLIFMLILSHYKMIYNNPFFAALVVFMITQLTDAGFTNYPYSANLALLLTFMSSYHRYKQSSKKVPNY